MNVLHLTRFWTNIQLFTDRTFPSMNSKVLFQNIGSDLIIQEEESE